MMTNDLQTLIVTEDNAARLRKPAKIGKNVKTLYARQDFSQSQCILGAGLFEAIVKQLVKASDRTELINQQFFNVDNYVIDPAKPTKGLKEADLLFKVGKTLFYLECKTNLALDSEKSKETDRKIEKLAEYILQGCPNDDFDILADSGCTELYSGLVSCWYNEDAQRNAMVSDTWFVEDIFEILGREDTEEEYYTAMAALGKLV